MSTTDPTTIEMLCLKGHAFSVRLNPLTLGNCPHGIETVKSDDKPPQTVNVEVTLDCPSCGKKYTVFGPVGERSCPSCGSRMVCPKCAAASATEPMEAVCPICGSPPAQVTKAPDLVFIGDVRKTIPFTGAPARVAPPKARVARKPRRPLRKRRGR